MSKKQMGGLTVLLFLLALVAGGCSGTGGQTPKWSSITYSLTGGIAGFDQQLTVGNDGSFSVTNRGQKVSSGKLSAPELQSVRDGLAAVPWDRVASKYIDPRVADAMFESVATKLNGHDYTTEVGTGGTPPAELRQFLDTLHQILRNHPAA